MAKSLIQILSAIVCAIPVYTAHATTYSTYSSDHIGKTPVKVVEHQTTAHDGLYPFTLEGVKDALSDFNFDATKHVYILHDIDGDGQKEMFIKEKIRDYNNYFVLNIEDGKVHLIANRESPNIEYYEVYDDGYFVHIQEGRDRGCSTNYKLVKSKVVAVSQYSFYSDWSGWKEGDKEPDMDESWTLNNKKVKKAVYDKYVPHGSSFSLYDLEGWTDLMPLAVDHDEYPAIMQLGKSGRSVSELVPSNWKSTQSTKGDLNKDGHEDLVIISLPDYKENILTRDDGYEINMNKPVIAVYLGNEYGIYNLWKSSTEVVPPMDEYMTIEGMSVEIKPTGVLWVKYSDFHSAGTADVNSFTQIYRAQDGGFYLIGDEVSSFSRYTHDKVTTSTNYLTGKRITNVKREKGTSPKDEVETIGKKPLRTFEEGE